MRKKSADDMMLDAYYADWQKEEEDAIKRLLFEVVHNTCIDGRATPKSKKRMKELIAYAKGINPFGGLHGGRDYSAIWAGLVSLANDDKVDAISYENLRFVLKDSDISREELDSFSREAAFADMGDSSAPFEQHIDSLLCYKSLPEADSVITAVKSVIYNRAIPFSEKLKPILELQARKRWSQPIYFSDYNLPMLDTTKIPAFMGQYVDGMAEALQVPKELVFSMSLACISTAAQSMYEIQIKDGYTQPLNIYTLCPLDPGNRKSSVVEAVSLPLRLWEASQKEKLIPIIREATSKRQTLEKAIAVKRDKAAKAANPADMEALQSEIWEMEKALPVIPCVPRLLADNITPEALASLMATTKECISILTAEGGIFDILAGMYSQKTPNLDLFLKAWTGNEVFRVDRKNDVPIILENPLLTLGISPQPITLSKRSASEIFHARGLDARFLYFIPQSLLGQRDMEPQNINPAIKAQWEQLILSLLPAEWIEDQKEKITLFLDDDAYKIWLEFSRSNEKELAEGGEFSSMTDWASKLPGTVARIAGLYHLASVAMPEKVKITSLTMKQAVYMGGFLAQHAKAAYALMGADERIKGAKKVLAWLRREALSMFSTQQCWQATKGTFHHMQPLREALQELEDRSFIKEFVTTETTRAGRKAAPSYMVNPLGLI